jgi:hypothetical protein
MLLEIVLDRRNADPGPILDPRLREVVLDQMEHAASVHMSAMIGTAPAGVMSRSAHLFGR